MTAREDDDKLKVKATDSNHLFIATNPLSSAGKSFEHAEYGMVGMFTKVRGCRVLGTAQQVEQRVLIIGRICKNYFCNIWCCKLGDVVFIKSGDAMNIKNSFTTPL